MHACWMMRTPIWSRSHPIATDASAHQPTSGTRVVELGQAEGLNFTFGR